MNYLQIRKFSRLFQSHKILLLALLGPFTDRNNRFLYLFIYLNYIVKSLPFHIPELKPKKGALFGRSLPVYIGLVIRSTPARGINLHFGR